MTQKEPPPDPGHRRHIAVALSYSPERGDDAPKVIASGRGAEAEQILDLAFRQGVKVREDPDLAEILAAVEIDAVIPLSAFVAVAEILKYVYSANHQPVPPPFRDGGRTQEPMP